MQAKNPTACVLIIGNEVLSGRTQDSNIRFLATKLGELGIPLREVRVIPDIALVVPFFLFICNLGLLDSLWSLIITYLAVTVPFSVFILVSYFKSLPDELDKAARVDGCSRWQTMTRIYLPLAMPSLVAVGLFAFLTSWSEFLLALMFTQTPKSQTLPIIVASFTSDFTISFSFINAAGVLAIVPPIVLAVIFERYIVSGLTAGAVKG